MMSRKSIGLFELVGGNSVGKLLTHGTEEQDHLIIFSYAVESLTRDVENREGCSRPQVGEQHLDFGSA